MNLDFRGLDDEELFQNCIVLIRRLAGDKLETNRDVERLQGAVDEINNMYNVGINNSIFHTDVAQKTLKRITRNQKGGK